MHATWQALQPMQVDTSISFATCCTCGRLRISGEGVVVAERAAMSRV